MAQRPESDAKGEIRDVRKFEAERCFSLRQARMLVAHLWSVFDDVPLDAALVAEDPIWIAIRDACAVLFLLVTGVRRFEFCRTVCGDVDLAEARIWIVGKGKIKDYVPLAEQGAHLIVRWLDLKRLRGESIAANAPLFCATGKSSGTFLSFSALRLRWKKVLAAAGLSDGYGLHTTRHTAGLIVLSQTKSLEKVARFLRHQKLSTTETFYRHIDPDELRQDLSEIDVWRAP